MPPKVLIVEDEVITALELRYHLEQLGYEVVETVSSGEKAIERAIVLEPDLLLMDVRLEGRMDGIEAAREIRTRIDVPVIFLTAFGDEETLSRAKETGPFGYILKPFQERELRATIEVALTKHTSHHNLQQSRDDLELILDGLRIGTAITDDSGRMTFFSRVARRLLGYEEDEGLGQLWHDVFPFPKETIRELRRLVAGDDEKHERLPVKVSLPRGRQYRMEVDVQIDPRNPDRRIFVFYDVTEVYDLRRQLDHRAHFHDLIGESEAMRSVFQQIEAVASVDTTVLIGGETGTGKELVARAIHKSSHRSQKPFVAVNCAALTEALAASQLFGHKRGAFTGAVSDEKGLFGVADGGTLFLDEIGDIPLDVQVNLLRVLEERTVTRIGETKPRKVDVRIVAASHRNLPAEVEAGRFRVDLLYRIRVARIDLPPLREHQSDIPILLQAFLTQASARIGHEIHDIGKDAIRCLIDYPWPGNVRELRNAMEYAVLRTQGAILQKQALPPEIRDDASLPPGLESVAGSEKDRIEAALQHTRGNRKEAAELLGISRATFYRRLAEHDLN